MSGYVVSLLLGVAGFAVMAAGGLVRHSHGGRGRSHSRGHGRGGARAAKGAARGAQHRAPGRGAAGSRAVGHLVLALTSPRFVFSVAMGLGLTGIVLHSLVSGWPRAALAIAGGVMFERLLVGPVWDSLMRFASEPALTLEHCTGDDAIAVTGFDQRGHGIVSVELDGQVVQLLATLQPDDHATGRVAAGTRVRIDDVDPAQNRCTVSRR